MKILYFNYLVKNLFQRRIFLRILDFPKQNIKSWSIVFFGSDKFSLVSLKALLRLKEQKVLSNLEVVTLEKTPVYEYSVAQNCITHLWLPNLNGSYDFGIIASYGKLIPKEIIEKFPLGIINVHGSLLPKYRGGMPVVHAIKNGETSTGITITRIRPDKFDVGEIIIQKSCLIGENELFPSLYERMAVIGCECLLEVISNMPECLKKCLPQSEEEVTYAPKLKQEVAVVKWNEMTALEVFNLYRALFGIYDLTTSWKGKKVKFVHLTPTDPDRDSLYIKNWLPQEPGSFTFNRKAKLLYVQCKDKPVAVCNSLKFNHKRYTVNDFYSGFLQNCRRTDLKFGN